MELPVLEEGNVWEEFREAVAGLGHRWTAPSGREYVLRFDGGRLEVLLETPDLEPPPSDDEVDADLLVLAGEVYDRVGGDWSSEALRGIAELWGWKLGP